MVLNCVAVGCTNYRGKKAALSFHRFPADGERRERWTAALRRANGRHWRPARNSRICNEHFVGGTISNDPVSPAYIPTIFYHTPSAEKQRRERALQSYVRREATKRKRRAVQRQTEAAGVLLTLHEKFQYGPQPEDIAETVVHLEMESDEEICVVDEMEDLGESDEMEDLGESDEEDYVEVVVDVEETQEEEDLRTERPAGTSDVAKLEQAAQTDLSASDIAAIVADNISLRSEVLLLKDKVNRLSISEDSFSCDDKVRCYTGLPSSQILKVLFNECSSYLAENSALSKFQQFIMTLMKMRMNLSMQFLSYMFDVNVSTVSRLFNSVIDVMYVRLLPRLVFGASGSTIRKTLPPNVETTQTSSRIDVEGVIGLARQKYTMLKSTTSKTPKSDGADLTTLDKVVHIACALCNTSESTVLSE
ncbi:uncharacterized protein LOC115403488 [Salarias fasciatus]|uniref:Uncharacterized LOC115403488 n=1 Tax=Salarias fasciatus TaxID=181472 RepID=A0A672G8Y5_SALFA|nr:uncharacterized protein LOC115403488 [Salarias fasciatus]